MPDERQTTLNESARTSLPLQSLSSTSPEVAAKELYAAWRLPEALAVVSEGLVSAPGSQVLHQLKAKILVGLGHLDEAEEAARTLLSLFPLDIIAIRQLKILRRPFEASRETAFAAMAALGGRLSRYVQAMHYLNEVELFEAALEVCELGLRDIAAREPSEAAEKNKRNLLLGRAQALEAVRRFEDALDTYRLIGGDKQFGTSMARCLLALGRFEEAERVLRLARPDLTKFSGLTLEVLQARGLIKEAYGLYRVRPISEAIATSFGVEHASTVELLSGRHRHQKVLIVAEGGPGDEIRMASLLPELHTLLPRMTATCEPRLYSLLSRSFPAVDFLPTRRYRKEVAIDMPDRVSLGNPRLLPCLSDNAAAVARGSDLVLSVLDALAELRPSREAFPTGPVLKPDRFRQRHWRERMKPDRLNIGIAWRSMLQSAARNVHYLEPSDFAPFADLREHIHLWSLQPHATQEELEQLGAIAPLSVPEDLDLVDDFEGQLALLSILDLNIAPFNTTGELAGSSGKPTLLLSLAASTGWRRGEDGSDIWHRNARIVSGTPIGDRVGIIRECQLFVRKLAGQISSSSSLQ